MSMSKRDYENIARVVRSNRLLNVVDPNAGEVIDDLCKDLATAFASDNERFDRDRFLTACEVVT